MRRLAAFIGPLLLVSACSAPPQKEIDMAQGALDAARAAGAEQYAVEAYAAASSALREAHDAVAQRDNRLALTRALDAHERAQEAARNAAEGRARARSEAEAAIVSVGKSLEHFRSRIKVGEASNLPRQPLDVARQAATSLEENLQKARAALRAGDYLGAQETIKDAPARISAETAALDQALAKKPARPPARGRGRT